MKLLICEYVTAGGLGPAIAGPLTAEADAMVQALVRDFSALADVQIRLLRCPSLPPVPQTQGLQVETATWQTATLPAALAQASHVLLVAPESDGILASLSHQAQLAGVRVLGCTADAVTRCGNKLTTASILLDAGIAHPVTFHGPAAVHQAAAHRPALHGPWVIKPVDGCGCDRVRQYPDLISAGMAWQALGTAQPGHLLQPWLCGQAASLSVLATATGTRLLSVNLQHLQIDGAGQVELASVQTGALQDRDGALTALAQKVADALPGLQGIFGIDVVLDQDQFTVIEINPRVTSAYPALAHVLGNNPAALWLGRDQAGCPAADQRPSPAAIHTHARPETHPEIRQHRAVTLGWDLGGAHVKLAAMAANGTLLDVVQVPCPLWRGLDQLDQVLTTLGQRFGIPERHAVTMSGEMVDLFADRPAGVQALLNCFVRHAGHTPVHVYSGAPGWLSPAACAGHAPAIASANWLASAHWAARHLADGILIDLGSTTCDLLPFGGGHARPFALGDRARLASGELVYTGLTRTPLMALAQQVTLDGVAHGVMAEWFASTADVYRVLGCLPDDADQHPSADGADKTLASSVRRLARMVGCDGPEYPLEVWQQLAGQFARIQVQRIGQALTQVLARGSTPPSGLVAVLAGVGRQVPATLLMELKISRLEFGQLGGLCAGNSALEDAASRAAPAVAVAALLHADTA